MIVKYFIVKCDNCGEEDFYTNDKSHSKVKEKALARGWQKMGHYDFCPACVMANQNRRTLTANITSNNKIDQK